MPKAHPPVRNTLGDVIGSWTVTLRYDEAADHLIVTVTRPSSRWLKGSTLHSSFKPNDLEDALAAVQVAVRTFGARRLF